MTSFTITTQGDKVILTAPYTDVHSEGYTRQRGEKKLIQIELNRDDLIKALGML